MESNTELVVPEELVPASAIAVLEPPKILSAQAVYQEALDDSKAGALDLSLAQRLDIKTKEDYKDALDLATALKGTINKLETHRKEKTDPLNDYNKNVKGMYDAPKAVYQSAVKWVEDRAKAWFAADQERIRLEKERLDREQREREEKAAAEQREREAAEQQARIQEEERLKKVEADRLAQAQAAGQNETDQMQADVAVAEERARIERAQAEREEANRKADEEKQAGLERKQREDAAARSTLDFTIPKGFREEWVPEIKDAEKVNRQFCVPDMPTLRAAVKGGLRETIDGKPNPLAAGLRIYKKLVPTGKGGGSR